LYSENFGITNKTTQLALFWMLAWRCEKLLEFARKELKLILCRTENKFSDDPTRENEARGRGKTGREQSNVQSRERH
jgi:hypothetical protein